MNKLEIVKFVESMRDRWDNASWQATGDDRVALSAQVEAANVILDQISASVTKPDFTIGDVEGAA